MSRNDPKFPWRVIGIASLLIASLGLAGWLLIWRGGGAAPTAADGGQEDGAEQSAVAAPGAGAAAPEQAPGAGTPTATPGAAAPTGQESPVSRALARSEAGVMDLQLFLIVPGLERLISVQRTVEAPDGLDAQVRTAVQELIGWTGNDTISPLPPEAGVRDVWISPGGIAYIDFDRAFYDFAGGGSLGELQAVYGVVATVVVSFPEIHAVQFLIEGRTAETLSGHVDLSRPLLLTDDWVILEPRRQRIQESDGG